MLACLAGTAGLLLPADFPQRDTVWFVLALLSAQLALSVAFYRALARLSERRSVAFSIAVAPGTIVHELSHAAVVLAILGRVTRMSLFRPDPASGVLGQVEYTLPKNALTTLRAFLVGVAPLFGCGAALLGLISLLKPGDQPWPIMDPASADTLVASGARILDLFQESLRSGRQPVWLTGGLTYLALTIAAGAAPSPTDFEGFFQWRGFVPTLVALAGVAAGAFALFSLWPAGRAAALLVLATTCAAQVVAVLAIEAFALVRRLASRGG